MKGARIRTWCTKTTPHRWTFRSQFPTVPSWWFQPIWNIWVKWDHSPSTTTQITLLYIKYHQILFPEPSSKKERVGTSDLRGGRIRHQLREVLEWVMTCCLSVFGILGGIKFKFPRRRMKGIEFLYRIFPDWFKWFMNMLHVCLPGHPSQQCHPRLSCSRTPNTDNAPASNANCSAVSLATCWATIFAAAAASGAKNPVAPGKSSH